MVLPLNHASRKFFNFSITLGIALFLSLHTYAQVQIWGASSSGGEDQIGSVFSVYDDGTAYETNTFFENSPEGASPRSNLVYSADGWYYGVSSTGGENGAGTFFRYQEASGFQILHQLNGPTDGFGARSELIEISNGEFIGTTFNGGANGSGTIFSYSDANGFEVLENFDGSTGAGNPSGGLTYDDGNQRIYGTTTSGGTSGFGTAYYYDLSGGITVMHEFEGGEGGSNPQSGLTLATDGLLYGSTQFGGLENQGSIFKIDPTDNNFELIYNLAIGSADGRYPYGKLNETSPGVFMGTCSGGAATGTGSIFKVTSDGEFTRLRSMSNTADGGFSKTGLITGVDGLQYGVAEFGGANGFGTLFRIDEEGTFEKLVDFQFTADGGNPLGRLSLGENDEIVGMTSNGGANNFGTLFQYNDADGLVKLHDLSLPLQGAQPKSLYAYNEDFYGATSAGGTQNVGTFYTIDLQGNRTKLHDFIAAEDGQNPNNGLYLDAGTGTFYGTARFGGNADFGTVFSVTNTGNLSVLHHFSGDALGQFPAASPLLHSNGSIYGTTTSGGDFGDGVLYEIDGEGNYTVLHHFFSFFDGADIRGQWVEGADGNIYTVARSGGSSGGGSILKYDVTGAALTLLHSFSFGVDGRYPLGTLLAHSDGKFYGTTTEGASGGGILFRYSEAEGFENLHEFSSSSDGSLTTGSLVEDEAGNVIGLNRNGGSQNRGTCYKYSEENGFEVVYNFSSGESPNPEGTPALFFPECYGDEDCIADDPCSVGRCNSGICEEIAINPSFEAFEIGFCEVGLDQYAMTLGINLDVSPGGTFTIAGEEVELTEALSYQIELTGLTADGAVIDLDYTFNSTGCTGTTGSLGTAPNPCPPIDITFILDANAAEVSDEGIFLGGNFQSWIPSENPMTETEPGIWEITLEIGSGDYEFNFFNGPSLFDAEFVVGSCAISGKRQLTVGEESETLEFCWASCATDCFLGLSSQANLQSVKIMPSVMLSGERFALEIPNFEHGIQYHIIDVSGRVVAQRNIQNNREMISTSGMASGVYTLYLELNGAPYALERFVVQK